MTTGWHGLFASTKNRVVLVEVACLAGIQLMQAAASTPAVAATSASTPALRAASPLLATATGNVRQVTVEPLPALPSACS